MPRREALRNQAVVVTGSSSGIGLATARRATPISVRLAEPNSIDAPLSHRARNDMGHEPRLPPPVYPPDAVADAILNAAVHPNRDIVVGGG